MIIEITMIIKITLSRRCSNTVLASAICEEKTGRFLISGLARATEIVSDSEDYKKELCFKEEK